MTGTSPAELVRMNGPSPGIETFIIEPPGLDIALRISIMLPARPALAPRHDGPIAAIYTTDADYFFGTVVDTARVGGIGGDIAPAAVIGIGYADEDGSLAFTNTRRFVDFYRGPRRSMDAGAYGSFEFGGADDFLAALRDHVIPAVERHVPAIDPARRVLLGTSAGGHFAVHALTQEPELFQGIALMSPILSDPPTGDGEMIRLVADLPDGALSSDKRVFLSAGSREEDPGTMFAAFFIISNAYRMRAALTRFGIATEFALFDDETHGSVTGAAISRALRFLLPQSPPDWQAALNAMGEDAA